jgi:uncharacterized alkaline shock family protein YloU
MVPERSMAGRSIVTRRAIVDIVRIAVQGSYGVMGFGDPSTVRKLLRWLGLDRPGIRLSTDGGLRLDLFINVAAGVPIAEVARQVDSAVRYSIHRHLGIEVSALAIHVAGVRYQPTMQPAGGLEPDSIQHEPTKEAESAAGVAEGAAEGKPAPRKRKAR